MRKAIIGCGFSCMDVIASEGNYWCDVGGTCANVLSGLSAMGWDSKLLVPEYEDRCLDSWLEERGITCVHFMRTKSEIPRIVQLWDRGNGKHRFITRCPWCGTSISAIKLPNRRQLIYNEVGENVLFCDRISEGIWELARQIKRNNGIVMYEPNGLRFYNQLISACCQFDIIKFSDDRVPVNWQNQLRLDLGMGQTKLMIVTMGAKGLKFAYRIGEELLSDWVYIESYELSGKRDSSGAGDWLTAAFLNCFVPQIAGNESLFSYKMIETSLLMAIKIAAYSCREMGAQGLLHSEKGIRQIRNEFGIELGTPTRYRRYEGEVFCSKCQKPIVL